MAYIILICDVVLRLYLFVLAGRAVLDLIRVLMPEWQPTGFLLVMANFVYGITDPPLRFLGRIIPPLRMGPVAFDLGFIVLFMAVSFLDSFIIRFY
ncbi:MAG: YggT family protein [Actinomycetaceae bacterium]|nr:YggT family protein [Actinomycetaceae bacterium]